MKLWESLEGHHYFCPVHAEPWRVVEAQHISTTRVLVDTLEEHDLLESMIEASKPPVESRLDYLLYTPFRYPPLAYGSRFGGVMEPSLWYGSLTLETAFAEVAWYQRLFIRQSDAELGYIETLMTAFKAFISTERGICLTDPPFRKFRTSISAPDSYEVSQALGSDMRAAGVEAFVFFSARSVDESHNISAFSPNVFRKKSNRYISAQQTWRCIANRDTFEVTRIDAEGKQRYTLQV